MNTKFLELNEFLKRDTNFALDLNPYQIASLLNIVGPILIEHIEQSQLDANYPMQDKISAENLNRLDGLFRELGDNFFPMAHTTLPLRSLRIAQSDSLRSIEELSKYTLRSTEQLSELLEHLSSRLREMDF